MTSVVNLNRFRKAKRRQEERQRAAENLALFGRSKEGRRAEDDAKRRTARELDAKRLDQPPDNASS